MYYLRTLLLSLLFISIFQHPTLSAPQTRQDSVQAITRDLYVLGHRYLRVGSNNVDGLRDISRAAGKLSSRARRLPDRNSPEARKLRSEISEFSKLVTTRIIKGDQSPPKVGPTSIRKLTTTLKPRNKKRVEQPRGGSSKAELVRIKGPTGETGGFSEDGLNYLRQELDQFGRTYRSLSAEERKDPVTQSVVNSSRNYFSDTVESSYDWAIRRLTTPPSEGNLIVVIPRSPSTIAYSSYAPSQHLQWAYDVAQLGIRFEAIVGGNSSVFYQWRTKIRKAAKRFGFSVTSRIK